MVFGISLLRNRRRHAALISHVLIATTIIEMLVLIMLQGIGTELIRPAIQLVILIALSVTVDPSLIQERELKRRLRDLEDREAAEEGMLGRDPEGKGYIELNFFNLFWVFVVCCVLGSSSRPSITWSSWTRASTRTAPACSTGPSRRSTALAPCS